MQYETELSFLQRTMDKCNLQVHLWNTEERTEEHADLGLRALLGYGDLYAVPSVTNAESMRQNTIYKVTDMFFCRYLSLILPDTDPNRVLVIGPYLTKEPSRQQLTDLCSRLGIHVEQRKLERYYGSIPVFTNENMILSVVETFAETVWGGSDAYTMIEIQQRQQSAFLDAEARDSLHLKEAEWNMQIIETRYAYENEIIEAVAHGQQNKAERLMAGFARTRFDRRTSDPVRNLKNYCVIMNTLMRKAAEQGAVHPVYLDETSTDYALRIERAATEEACEKLMWEMISTYCGLVKKHSVEHYSPPVQRAVAHIRFKLTDDLSLRALSAMLNLNASYFSGLFKQETGQTVTAYVKQERIRHAVHLLSTTNLQIQTIALYCGISDMNYFSKVFKKQMGKTPREYRESLQGTLKRA